MRGSVVMLMQEEGDNEVEAVEVDCRESVALSDTVAVQEGGASKPACGHCEQPVQGTGAVRLATGQKFPAGQVRQVLLEAAPVELL